MADLVGMQKAVDKLTNETVPALTTAVEALVEQIDRKLDENAAELVKEAHALLDRLNGTTITIHIPERKT
ncbi:MAG: hypothetical protein GXX84_11780 [Acidobacteria bacterium]|nr:hypothetical protein [Acidobacteriota bacterium]